MLDFNKIFLGNTPSEQRRYLFYLLNKVRSRKRYHTLVVPAVGQFAIPRIGIEAGFYKSRIFTSDISLFSTILGCLFSGRKLSSIGFKLSSHFEEQYLNLKSDVERAARAAGINEIYVLSYDTELSRDVVKSKQLAHNALSGVDDEQILREIYATIGDLDARIATGLKNLEWELEVGAINVDEVTLDMDYEVLNIIFLPREKRKFDDVIELMEKKAGVVVEKLESFEPFKAALREVGFQEDIRNISCILSKMADIVAEYYMAVDGQKEKASG